MVVLVDTSDSGTENTGLSALNMNVYGVKVENFVETFSFLERQPPNPVIRGHKKSAVGNRLNQD